MIFALPLYDDNPIRETPIVTYGLIGMCIGAYLWQLGQNAGLVAHQYGMIPAVLFGYRDLPPGIAAIPPWATIFTSMFLHGGLLHLGGNMLFLWIFGNNIEDLLGRARFLVLYFGAGVAAALTQAVASPHSMVPMIGASGAIAGVLAAYLMTYPRANVHCFLWLVIFFWIVTVPAWVLLGVWFALQLIRGLAVGPGSPGVAVWAHIGGFGSGLVIYLLMRPLRVRLLQPQRSAVWAAAAPSAFIGRRTFHRGSVPDSGTAFRPPPGPWG
ncbi:MAG: rhomboid family intramembrane serine protease [Alphaproteobacteria bacterium]|nr:rhomboid family intramembrane serine protease [Alphaproteobacteria bacterium]